MEETRLMKDLLIRRWPFVLLGIIAALHIFDFIDVDIYGVALLFLAFLPVLLPLLATYLDTLKIGKDGVEGKMKANNEGKVLPNADQFDLIASNEKLPEGDALFPLRLEARRVIATLWHYQKELFGENSLRRWGFGVGLGAPNFSEFSTGVSELAKGNFVHVDSNGLCYLTNEGIDFCQEHRDVVDADGPFYSQFSPVKGTKGG